MFRAFCYVCKEIIESATDEDFRKCGHVSTKNESQSRYHVSANRLHRSTKVKVGKRVL